MLDKQMIDIGRVEKVQKALAEWEVDCLLINRYSDLFYLTGMEVSAGSLFVFPEDLLFVIDGRYFEKCKKSLPFEVLLQEKDTIKRMFKRKNLSLVKTVGFDSDFTTYANYLALKELFESVSGGLPHSITLVPIPRPLQLFRAIKDKTEIQKLQKSAELCCLGFDFVISQIKLGITEKEIANELEVFWKKKDADRISFNPIIAFGKNTSMPHYRPQNTPLKKNDLILIDIGVSLEGYNSDVTRMACFGKPESQFLEIFQVVKTAQETARKACIAGISVSDLDKIVRDSIKKSGFGKYFVHSLGHGVGIEIHEFPAIKSDKACKIMLSPGMVVTIEPGVYLPEVGGVRIEDTILVKEHENEIFTKLSHELFMIA